MLPKDMDKLNRLSWLASLFTLSCLIPAPSQAQVTSDGTVSTEVTTSDNRNFIINGNSQAGGNLFHSFSQFSIPNGGSASFNNGTDVVNIIGRVTGGSVSDIDGLITAKGNANLFLINPNGIIFGPNAQLNIGGSFIASTASRINFADGNVFSATDLQAPPLLTVSVPNGLQLGKVAGSIVNRSNLTDTDENPVELRVQSNRTLALVGSKVILENGFLIAPSGRIEIGSVASDSLVSLTPIAAGWNLGYENVQNFQDIRLFEGGANTISLGNISGEIHLQGRQIDIDGSQVGGINYGTTTGGNLEIRGSESVTMNDSFLSSATKGSGAAGNITIETKQLFVSNASAIDALTNSDGQGGSITINASDSVEVNGNGKLTQITSQSFNTDGTEGTFKDSGNAGKIEVNTNRLILKDGGQISTSTSRKSTGDAGIININATEFVVVSSQGLLIDGSVVKSGVFAKTEDSFTTGDGGSLNIKTGRLVVQDGGSVSVASVDGSTGQAGNLTIAARTISLNNQGQLTATSEADKGGGNITLQNLESLILRGKSEISTNAGGEGNGGDITIGTKLLTVLGNSKITANAIGEGNGGNVRIKTQGLFLSPNSEISATSQRGVDGVVEIDRLENDPEGALLTLPAEPVNISGLIAQGCSSGGGSIARNSKFVVTGRGGLPPTPKEAFRGDVALADLGKPIETKTTQAKAIAPTNQKPPESTPLVEAQGWVIGSEGEVILTASAPNVTPSVPWMKSSSCHG
jgi:filamentous hemagglutinin family protein